MENGHWSAIRDGIVDEVKSNRPASIGDFILIVTQMHKKEIHTSIALLAKRLCWSRRKTGAWLEKVGLEIEYFGKVRGSSNGILRAISKENLDPENKNIWFVVTQ